MYCFSRICRICLENCENEFKSLSEFDFDNIQIEEKLKFCIPEIVSDNKKLPDCICNNCQLFLKQMYKFKQMSIANTEKLQQYMSKFMDNTSSENIKSNLSVKLNTNTDIDKINKNKEIEETNSEGISMYSISLNQWDLFETKFTCRCIKEYNSFTENTTHLCKNCEGELLGFRLSKIKVGIAENRYNNTLTNEDSNSSFSPSEIATSKNNEHGFNYNDILLCKVHVSGVNKQINVLRSLSYTETQSYSIENNDALPNNKKYKCSICNKSYTRRLNLYNHFTTHEDFTIYSCTHCVDKFIDKEEFDQHQLQHLSIKSENYEILSCSTCKKIFNHKSQLAIHLMTHFCKEKFKCLTCSKEFFQKENLEEHKQLHTSDRKYRCSTCDKSYCYNWSLQRHKKKHAVENFHCSICKAQFINRDILENHIYIVHMSKNKQKEYIDGNYCKICDITLSKHTNMKKHAETHSNRKIYKCTICNLEFKNRFIMVKHMQVHAKERFKCNKCNKHYMSKKSLFRHISNHSK